MGVFIEQSQLELAISIMEESNGKFKSFEINRQLTEESIQWLRYNGYHIRIYGFMTTIADKEENFPSNEEIKRIRNIMLREMYDSMGENNE